MPTQEGMLGYDSLGRQQREYGQRSAEQALQRALRYYGLQERELADLRKSDPRKMLIGECIKCDFCVKNRLDQRATEDRAPRHGHLGDAPVQESARRDRQGS